MFEDFPFSESDLIKYATGAATALVGRSLGAWVVGKFTRPRLVIREGALNTSPLTLPNPHRLAHLEVINMRRQMAPRCVGTISATSQSGQVWTVDVRWSSKPEPHPPNMIRDIIAGREMDVSHRPEAIGVALKFQGDPDCYLFTGESYLHPRCCDPSLRLRVGTYAVRVSLKHHDSVAADFVLENNGPMLHQLHLRAA